MSRRHKTGSPWTAARAEMQYDRLRRVWYVKVVNYWNVTVWRDNTGRAGFENLMTTAAQIVYAVRIIDGIGQGRHMKDFY